MLDVNTKSTCFIIIKDHKENFLHHPKVRLVNPAKKWAWKNKQDNPWQYKQEVTSSNQNQPIEKYDKLY